MVAETMETKEEAHETRESRKLLSQVEKRREWRKRRQRSWVSPELLVRGEAMALTIKTTSRVNHQYKTGRLEDAPSVESEDDIPSAPGFSCEPLGM